MPSVSTTLRQDAYIPIPVEMLKPAQVVGVSLYRKNESSHQFQLYRSKHLPLVDRDLQQLLKYNVTTLFVQAGEHAEYQKYLRDNLETILDDESSPIQDRFASFNEVVRDLLSQAFENGKTEQVVACSSKMARHSVDLICRDDLVASDLLGMMYHDYHTFTHSANVSYFCVLLARELGISNETILHEIAAGALLHDIGKLDTLEQILTKPGKLTDAEYDLIKRHPTTGFLKLCRREDLSIGQLMMVYQHHERVDGKGYPVGIGTSEIHDWAKLCAVADVFNALTSHRPYRLGMSIDQALEVMDRDSGYAFDEEMLQCWKKTIACN